MSELVSVDPHLLYSNIDGIMTDSSAKCVDMEYDIATKLKEESVLKHFYCVVHSVIKLEEGNLMNNF